MTAATGLYLYGVMRRNEAVGLEVSPLPGGGRVEALATEGIAVLASAMPPEAPRRTRRNLLSHTRVLEVAMARGAVLPMRFGVIADDADAMHRSLAPRLGELERLLDRFDGRAEFGLRVSWPREAALRALAASRPDLAARRASLARQGAGHHGMIDLGRDVAEALAARRGLAQRRLVAALAPLADDIAIRAPETDVQVLRAEVLLAPAHEAAFLEGIEAATAALDFAPGAAPEIRWVGPAPVFTFATMSLDRPVAASAGRT